MIKETWTHFRKGSYTLGKGNQSLKCGLSYWHEITVYPYKMDRDR